MLIAVTGGNGFIGRKLVEHHLKQGDSVRVLTRQCRTDDHASSLRHFFGDLATPDIDLTAFVDGAEVLYHCAAELRDTTRMPTVNVGGTERLIQAASGRIGRWVQLSSVGAYGPVRSGEVTEETPEKPVGAYEVTKTRADELVRNAARTGGFSLTVLRPSIVYGPDMSSQSIFQMFAMIRRGLFFYVGPSGAVANYVHVDDVVRALALCATHPTAAGETFNLSATTTMEQFVAAVAGEFGDKPPRLRLPLPMVSLIVKLCGRLPGFPLTASRVDALTNRASYSSAKIQQKLGFQPKISVCEGMAQLVRVLKTAP